MQRTLLNLVIKEIADRVTGRRVEGISGSDDDILIDLRLPGKQYLLISASPAFPRIHLVRGKKPLSSRQRAGEPPSQFLLLLRKHLSGLRLLAANADPLDRIVFLEFGSAENEPDFILICQMTGRSANLFLTDAEKTIIAAAKEGRKSDFGGKCYSPPAPPPGDASDTTEISVPDLHSFPTVSDAISDFYRRRIEEYNFRNLAAVARSRIRKELQKKQRLAENLRADLTAHGDAEKWKRFGELLLSSASTAQPTEHGYLVKDYYDELTPEIEIPVAEGDSPSEAAEKYFRQYRKAQNAVRILGNRLTEVEAEIGRLEAEAARIEEIIGQKDVEALSRYQQTPAQTSPVSKKDKLSIPGCRRFISGDGFEILVGKKDKDNDFLTFRVAASRDMWLHAADYPGSHVIIRTGGRKEIPQRTLIEAARLAAFYSKAGRQAKAAVHYTLRKNVHKRKGSPPGQVSLSEFKTLLVEPGIVVEPNR